MNLNAEMVAILWTVLILVFTAGYIFGASVNISKEYDRTVSQMETPK